MITLSWFQLVVIVAASHIGVAISNASRWYRNTCPRKRMLPRSKMLVRCDQRLDHGECPEHGQVR